MRILGVVVIASLSILFSPIPCGSGVMVVDTGHMQRDRAVRAKTEVSRAEPEYILLETTAYTWTGNRTASGEWPRVGTCAVDTDIFPFGTILKINGKEYVAKDTGGAIKGYKVDIYMDSKKEALEYGRKTVIAEVVR